MLSDPNNQIFTPILTPLCRPDRPAGSPPVLQCHLLFVGRVLHQTDRSVSQSSA